MRKEFLIGFTKDYEIIMADLELQNRNFENEFTASFSTSSIINADNTIYDEDYVYEYVESMLNGYDKNTDTNYVKDIIVLHKIYVKKLQIDILKILKNLWII